MKLIEALIVAQQEYGIYGDWKATHTSGCFVGRGPHGMYFACDHDHHLLSQSDRLETVISDFAEKHPEKILDEQWKVSRYGLEAKMSERVFRSEMYGAWIE